MSVRILPEEISIWSVRLSKEDDLYQCWWVSFNLLKALIDQKGGGEVSSLPLFKLKQTIFTYPRTSRLKDFGLLDSEQNLHQQSFNSWAFGLGFNYTTSFPNFPASDSRLWDSSASITEWANSLNKSYISEPIESIYLYHIYICLFVYLFVCLLICLFIPYSSVSLENSNTHIIAPGSE